MRRGFAMEHRHAAPWVLALGLGLAGQGAVAQGLPAHAVEFDPATAGCRILLQPAGTTGTKPPRLFLSADLLGDRFAYGLDGSDIAEAVMIRDGARTPFLGREGMTAGALGEDPFWAALAPPDPVAADAAKDSAKDAETGAATKAATPPATAAAGATPAVDSLYLTVRDRDGAYSSARYDDLTRDGVFRLAALACRATGLPVTPQTPVEYRDAEAALALPPADVLHIRQVLAARYGEPGLEVGDGTTLTVTDRRHIASLNTEKGYPSGEYLWPASVKDLLAEAVTAPKPAPAPASGEEVVATHGDWLQLRADGGATCRIATSGSAVDGLAPGLRLEFAVGRGDKGGRMAFDLVKPNPFRADMPLGAKVGEETFALMVEPSSGAVIPKPFADGTLSNGLMVALRRGKEVTIGGVATVSGAPATVTFSAIGFSAAFAAMAKDCNRPGVMGWIG